MLGVGTLIFHLLVILSLLNQASSQPSPVTNPYFAPYLKPGEIPDGATIPLFHEVWTIMGSDLTDPNFTAQVDLAATQIFSSHFPTKATGSSAGVAAPTYLDGLPGKAFSSCLQQANLCTCLSA